jgi:Xaa-Pro dipeptidase
MRFGRKECEHRLQRVQSSLSEANIDGLLVFDEPNYYYLTGHYTEAWKIPFVRRACWVPRDGEPILVVPAGEEPAVRALSPWSDVREYAGPDWGAIQVAGDDVPEFDTSFTQTLIEVGRSAKLDAARRLAIPLRGWSHQEAPLYVIDDVRAAFSAVWVDATPALWAARLVKSPAEIEYAREAVHVLDRAFAATFAAVAPGMPETEIARIMRANLLLAGGEHEVFTFVETDIGREGIAGAAPGEAVLTPGEVMFIDAGALYGGYKSDYDRLAAIGKPSAAQEQAYALVARAQRTAFDMVRPGVTAGAVASAMAEILEESGAKPGLLVGELGHGIGLELPEPPYLHPRSTLPLQAGMVITLEPNVIVPGVGRVILEDVIVVTDDGAEHLSTAPTTPELLRL